MSDETAERKNCFEALVSALEGSFPLLKDETSGGQPMIRIIHRGAIYNLVLSLSREQKIDGDWI